MKRWLKAKKIVDKCQKLSFDQTRIGPDSGFHLTFNPLENQGALNNLKKLIGRDFPYRSTLKDSHLFQLVVDKQFPILYSPGNEMENDINAGVPFGPEAWRALCKRTAEEFGGNIGVLASPALMTIKQKKDFWPKIIDCEKYFDYWCLNSHFPAYIKRRESGIGDYIECIKRVHELMKFRDATTKGIFFAELGVGQYHWISPPDLKFLYYVHKEVFGLRGIAYCFYDSDIALRLNGQRVL